MTPTTQPAPIPSPPPFYFSTDLTDDEADVDLDDDDELDLPSPADDPEDTRIEPIECLGEYPSLAAYFCCALEDLIDPSIQWILKTMDMKQVQRRFEGNRYRYFHEGRAVYRQGLPQSKKDKPKDPEPDPAGPWMPTRGRA